MTALDAALAAIAEQAPKSAAARNDAMATWYANRPQFIPELVYGRRLRVPIMWPFPGKTAVDLLQDCHALLSVSDAGIRNGLAVNYQRRVSLLDAEAALLRLLLSEDADELLEAAE